MPYPVMLDANNLPMVREYLSQHYDPERIADSYAYQNMLPWRAGEAIGRGINRLHAPLVGDVLAHAGSHTGSGVGLGGILGTLAGLAMGKMTGRDSLRSALVGAGVGGVAGGALSALAQSNSATAATGVDQTYPSAVIKQADWYPWSPPVETTSPDLVNAALLPNISQKVMLDQSMSTSQKLSLNSLLEHLNTEQLQSLNELIRRALGASAGWVVARYLLKTGVLGGLLAGAAGSWLASSSPDSRPKDMYGRTY